MNEAEYIDVTNKTAMKVFERAAALKVEARCDTSGNAHLRCSAYGGLNAEFGGVDGQGGPSPSQSNAWPVLPSTFWSE